MDQKTLFRKLPSMNDLLNSESAKKWEQEVDTSVVKEMITKVLDETRSGILAGKITELRENFFDNKEGKL